MVRGSSFEGPQIVLAGREVMTGQAAIRLFQIDVQPGVGTIEGWRNLSGPESYRLSVAGQPDWLMTPQTGCLDPRGAGTPSSVGDGRHANVRELGLVAMKRSSQQNQNPPAAFKYRSEVTRIGERLTLAANAARVHHRYYRAPWGAPRRPEQPLP
jgi:hypothetical protein